MRESLKEYYLEITTKTHTFSFLKIQINLETTENKLENASQLDKKVITISFNTNQSKSFYFQNNRWNYL